MPGIEAVLSTAAGFAARLCEASAILVIAIGAIQAIFRAVVSVFTHASLTDQKRVWVGFATWLLLGLEFELAADIVRSIVAPTWQDIAQLAAIAAIRTFLNFFLGRDVQEFQDRVAAQ